MTSRKAEAPGTDTDKVRRLLVICCQLNHGINFRKSHDKKGYHMIKLIQQILEERKARKRQEYLNEWKEKEPDLCKKMEHYRELAQENEAKASQMYHNDMGVAGYAHSAAASDYEAKAMKCQKELEKLGFEPEKYL